MKDRTRLTLIGGFLGSGKTTLINKLAELLISEKKKVGVITNDQGKYLIDTEFVRAHGIDVEEVTGSCFCCNFPKFFENAEKLSNLKSDGYILAEPVGSCTDLIATIMNPLTTQFGDTFSITPLIILVDGARMMNRSLDSVNLGGYLRRHQVAEAEVLVLTKTDRLGPDEIRKFHDELRSINPTARIIDYSAVSGLGLNDIADIIKSDKETDRRPVEIDYDRYAEAEAELGWYNGTYEFVSPGLDAYSLSASILRAIGSKYPVSSVAHAKVALSNDDVQSKVSLIGDELTVGGMIRNGKLFGRVQLNINARIASDPESLRRHIRESVDSVMRSAGIDDCKMVLDDCFSPGKPNPTYRIV